MKAICVTSSRTLEVRDIPKPETPPPGHILVDMDSATITHGDKFFLPRPRQPADQRYDNACLFGAICPARGIGATRALPFIGT